jgi:hypothetical protein
MPTFTMLKSFDAQRLVLAFSSRETYLFKHRVIYLRSGLGATAELLPKLNYLDLRAALRPINFTGCFDKLQSAI